MDIIDIIDQILLIVSIDYFANSVYGENSVNEICWDIARNCISQLQFEDCVVYLLDEEKQLLIQKAAYGPKNPKGHEIVDPIEIPSGYGIVGTVMSDLLWSLVILCSVNLAVIATVSHPGNIRH